MSLLSSFRRNARELGRGMWPMRKKTLHIEADLPLMYNFAKDTEAFQSVFLRGSWGIVACWDDYLVIDALPNIEWSPPTEDEESAFSELVPGWRDGYLT